LPRSIKAGNPMTPTELRDIPEVLVMPAYIVETLLEVLIYGAILAGAAVILDILDIR